MPWSAGSDELRMLVEGRGPLKHVPASELYAGVVGFYVVSISLLEQRILDAQSDGFDDVPKQVGVEPLRFREHLARRKSVGVGVVGLEMRVVD